MLTLTDRGTVKTCDGVTRRDFCRWALGAVGLSLPQLMAAQDDRAVAKEHDDRSCIMIFNLGAPSQIDTFDMKPERAAEDPRAVQADLHQVARHPDLRNPAAARPTRRQVLAGPQLLSHRAPPSTTPATR